jgi:predicted 3-demethylubiquinone-9 3-methyltransferase (glyoxalase superfamily)
VTKASTALMFISEEGGRAEAALTFYAAHIPGLSVQRIERNEEADDPRRGDVRRAEFTIGDARLIAFDSPPVHAFRFTPAVSIWLDVDSIDDFDLVVDALTEGGAIHMRADDYGFSRQFAWVADRFGVSWQINLPLSH